MQKTHIIRITLGAALLALASCSPHAGAQSPADFNGTWAFRTEPFTPDPNSSISGAAIVTQAGQNHYTIHLVANQFVAAPPASPIQAKPGETAAPQAQLVTARENCTGDLHGLQLDVTCSMAEPLAHYTPDNFSLQTQNADTLTGVLSSGDDQAQITFTRVR